MEETKLQQLLSFAESKQRNRNAFDRELQKDRESLLAAAKKRIEEELRPRTDILRGMNQEYIEAQLAVEQERVRIAKEDHSGPWPVGTRVFKMKTKYGSIWDHHGTTQRLDGVVEVVERGTRFPDNMASYSRPSVGDFIVRILTKDGKPGLKFENISYFGVRDWKAIDGTKPNVNKPKIDL